MKAWRSGIAPAHHFPRLSPPHHRYQNAPFHHLPIPTCFTYISPLPLHILRYTSTPSPTPQPCHPIQPLYLFASASTDEHTGFPLSISFHTSPLRAGPSSKASSAWTLTGVPYGPPPPALRFSLLTYLLQHLYLLPRSAVLVYRLSSSLLLFLLPHIL